MDVRGKVISADCHIDLIWLPPDLFADGAPAHLKERMPYVDQNDQGRDVWVSAGRGLLRARERHGLGGARVCPGRDPPLGPDGRPGPLRGRSQGDPPAHRARAPGAGPGSRRGPRRSALRDSRGREPTERPRGGGRGHADLQRMACRLQRDPPRPLRRHRLHPPTTTSRRRWPRSSGSRSGAPSADSRSRTPST